MSTEETIRLLDTAAGIYRRPDDRTAIHAENDVDIDGRTKRIIAEELCVDQQKVTSDARLDDFGFDSLDMVEICLALEDEFEVELPYEEASALSTAGEFVGFVTKHLDLKAARQAKA